MGFFLSCIRREEKAYLFFEGRNDLFRFIVSVASVHEPLALCFWAHGEAKLHGGGSVWWSIFTSW
jgi:hypothetical protein